MTSPAHRLEPLCSRVPASIKSAGIRRVMAGKMITRAFIIFIDNVMVRCNSLEDTLFSNRFTTCPELAILGGQKRDHEHRKFTLKMCSSLASSSFLLKLSLITIDIHCMEKTVCEFVRKTYSMKIFQIFVLPNLTPKQVVAIK